MKKAVAAAILCAIFLAAQDQPPQQQTTGPRGRGGQGPNFPQQTRQLATPEILARGKAVYGVYCTACHGGDLRGGDQGGPSLLRSLTALSDQHGELIAPIIRGSRQEQGMPPLNLNDA